MYTEHCRKKVDARDLSNEGRKKVDVRDLSNEGGKKVHIFGTYTLSPENIRKSSVVGGQRGVPGKTAYI